MDIKDIKETKSYDSERIATVAKMYNNFTADALTQLSVDYEEEIIRLEEELEAHKIRRAIALAVLSNKN